MTRLVVTGSAFPLLPAALAYQAPRIVDCRSREWG